MDEKGGTLTVWCAEAAGSPEIQRHVEVALAELAPATNGEAGGGGTEFRFEAGSLCEAGSTWASP